MSAAMRQAREVKRVCGFQAGLKQSKSLLLVLLRQVSPHSALVLPESHLVGF